MPVYVDSIMMHGWVMRGRRVKSCHLIADTIEELHEMAKKIGLKREWFQEGSTPHYDLVPSRRQAGVALGVVELDRREYVNKLRELRGDLPL